MPGPKKPLFQPPVARGKPGWLQEFAKDLAKEDAGQVELQVGRKLELWCLLSLLTRRGSLNRLGWEYFNDSGLGCSLVDPWVKT